MKVIVCGSTDWDSAAAVSKALNILAAAAVEVGDREFVVVHAARFPEPVDGQVPLVSVDWLAELWARRWSRFELTVRIDRRPQPVSQSVRLHCLGMLRPRVDLVLAFVRGGSESASVLVELAERREITTKVIDYDDVSDAAEVSS